MNRQSESHQRLGSMPSSKYWDKTLMPHPRSKGLRVVYMKTKGDKWRERKNLRALKYRNGTEETNCGRKIVTKQSKLMNTS